MLARQSETRRMMLQKRHQDRIKAAIQKLLKENIGPCGTAITSYSRNAITQTICKICSGSERGSDLELVARRIEEFEQKLKQERQK